MATSSPHLQEGSIRKIRSAGDLPRAPEGVHLPSIHITEATPNLHDVRPTSNNAAEVDVRPPSPHRSRPPSTPLNDLSPAQLRPPTPIPPAPPFHEPRPPILPTAANSLRAPNTPEHQNNVANSQHNGSLYMRLSLYFGLGRHASRARKALVSLIWTICWNSAQVIVITTMLILSGTLFKSHTTPSLSEWKACDRPLGPWASIWVVRAILALVLAIWEYRRDQISQMARDDIEGAGIDDRPSASAIAQHNGANINDQGHRPTTHYNDPSNNVAAPQPPALAHSALYSRLTLLSSLITLSWFLTAHILEYSSINTCRHSSPHLWWLVFGILCIMYLMVLELVLLGVIVLIITPILFIFWNIFLICLGRHPIQNPGMIKPEIKGLPKSVVERIPLVIYIPPPPQDEKEKENDTHAPHIYPPKNPPVFNAPQKRFKLLRNFSSFKSKKGNGNGAIGEKEGEVASKDDVDAEDQGPIAWEDNWEKTDYPFVALEGNRAAYTTLSSSSSSPTETQDATISEEQRQQNLRLEDAGEGPQPLRLLACGHVFHRTCLDPWLIDVSGRCPICQRPVVAPRPPKKSRRRS
ncbi:hypothetical protein BJ912DRAFT_947237 [Pholiota molesta]|nr:hypothetical protein BJ912DRAFT_947237 [Pholiota molesta]